MRTGLQVGNLKSRALLDKEWSREYNKTMERRNAGKKECYEHQL